MQLTGCAVTVPWRPGRVIVRIFRSMWSGPL